MRIQHTLSAVLAGLLLAAALSAPALAAEDTRIRTREEAARHAVQLAHPGFMLAVVGDKLGVVKVAGDQIGAEGVARQQHITAYVARLAVDVVELSVWS